MNEIDKIEMVNNIKFTHPSIEYAFEVGYTNGKAYEFQLHILLNGGTREKFISNSSRINMINANKYLNQLK